MEHMQREYFCSVKQNKIEPLEVKTQLCARHALTVDRIY